MYSLQKYAYDHELARRQNEQRAKQNAAYARPDAPRLSLYEALSLANDVFAKLIEPTPQIVAALRRAQYGSHESWRARPLEDK